MPHDAPAKPAKPSLRKTAAVVCYFDTSADVYKACESLRDAGYKKFDAHTPFPVHGLEKAMGIPPSPMSWIALAAAAAGLVTAFTMQWWISVIDYPLNISGKPTFSLPAWVPICFELTVLFCAFGCFFGIWTLNGLPRLYHHVMKHPSFHRATDDKFFVSIETNDPHFESNATRTFLEKLGAHEIAEVEP